MIAILTLVLAFATVWLAVATNRMASATKEMADLAAEPYLSFDGINLDRRVHNQGVIAGANRELRGYDIHVILGNPGQVRIQYTVTQMLARIEGVEYPPRVALQNTGGPIHPKMQTRFSYPTFECAEELRAGLRGELEMSVEFWSVDNDRKRMDLRTSFTVLGIGDGQFRVDYLFMSGPTYS